MKLFENFEGNGLRLQNRVVMAPMTRARNKDGIPGLHNSEYYTQRAGSKGAGLIITEGIRVSPAASGVLFVPGLYNDQQLKGWRVVTDRVHEKGTTIFAQLWHVGRVAHTSTLPAGQPPLSSSDIQAANTFAYGYNEEGIATFVPASKPVEMDQPAIEKTIEEYVVAARNAIEAGFDGIEIHGANGYLIEQFLNPHVNVRTDQYGGSIGNRCRFLLELIDRLSEHIDPSKIGVRLSPYSTLNDMQVYPEIQDTYIYLAQELSRRRILYTHLMNFKGKNGEDAIPDTFLNAFRNIFNGIVILAGGMTKEKSRILLNNGLIDLAAFGQLFISNPDLTYRLHNDFPLAPADRATFYGGGEKGYTDYDYYTQIKSKLA